MTAVLPREVAGDGCEKEEAQWRVPPADAEEELVDEEERGGDSERQEREPDGVPPARASRWSLDRWCLELAERFGQRCDGRSVVDGDGRVRRLASFAPGP